MPVTTTTELMNQASPQSWRAFFRRASACAAIGSVCYLGLLLALSHINWQGYSLLTRNTGYFVDLGGDTFTAQRFQDAQNHPPVDILFCGSSRSYLSFDPRPFAQSGISSFDIGSAGQSPLNTYFLLKHYYSRFSPKLVVLEVYYVTLGIDGLECYYDLLGNTIFNSSMAEMCVAVGSPKGYNATAAVLVQRIATFDFDIPVQRPTAHRVYVGEGFVTTDEQASDSAVPEQLPVVLQGTQVEYLRKAIDWIKHGGGEVVLVIPPLPKKVGFPESGLDHPKKIEIIEYLAESRSTRLLDFSESLKLDPHLHFFDDKHLNSLGAAKFSKALCDSLLVLYPRLLSNTNH